MLVKGNHKIIVLFLLLGGSYAAKAQQASILLPIAYSLKDSVKLPEIAKKNLLILRENGINTLTPIPWHSPGIGAAGAIRPDYFTRQWGIFCEGEWRIEKKTGIPLRVRLGSLEYVDRLEGKQ